MRRRWRLFRRHRLGVAGAVIAGALLIAAAGAPILARQDPLGMQMTQTLRPPSAQHWFGTDQFGRDVWARVIYGARLSVTVGFLTMVLATAAGVPLGAAAGYLGGIIDAVAMRLMDAVPGPSAASGIAAIGIVYIPVLARVTRGAVLARGQAVFGVELCHR